jgi:aspartyl protease family protein
MKSPNFKNHLKIILGFALILNTQIFIPEICISQDLNVAQTLDYLNTKFSKFPYENEDGSFRYNFSVSLSGELKIEQKHYINNPFNPSDVGEPAITFYKIAIDKIDLKESFQSFKYNATSIYIYPSWNGTYYEEALDFLNIAGYKKTVPAMTSSHRNMILMVVGDVSQIQNINNAFFHLCTLIISDPIKYGLNKEPDPFEKNNETQRTNIALENPSNSIKILKTENGLIEVPIVLNDVLKINFIFDSGASEVSLSPDVALTLIRTGTISESDWLPSQTYSFADGSTAKSKRFLIKKLVIGNQILTNIEASISKSIEAPMLIGQNVMNKLGSITIDYENQLLIIKTK